MNVHLSMPSVAAVRGTLASFTLATACSAAWALPSFVINPAAAGLNSSGGAVSADSFTFATVSTVTRTSATTFSEIGLLSVQSLSFEGETVSTPGLNTADVTGYGLYVAFSGNGNVTQINSTTSIGEFTSLTYTLYGYNGKSAKFGFSGNTPTVTGITGPLITLVSGSGTGEVATVRNVPSANALVDVNRTVAGTAFFQSPTPFYLQAETSFISTASALRAFAGGFRITQGGGSFNFIASPVPELETYALLLMGLGAVGLVSRRRRIH